MKNKFLKWDVGGGSRSIIQSLNLFTSRNLFKSLKSILMVVALLSLSSNVWGDDVTLTNAQIVAGTGGTGYGNCSATDSKGNTWNAYAIKNHHSSATSSYKYWQIKKYASSTAYYVQVPEMPGKITQIVMTVSNASQPMTGGGNSATLYFSSSNSTSAAGTGIVSGTGASSVTIDASSLKLKSGYITAGGAVRIWNVTVTYEAGSSTTYYLAGSMNDWSTTADQFTGTPLSVTKNLSANTSYTFKVATNGTWDTSYGKNYTINRQYCTDITLDGSDNVTLQTDKAGDYTFNITINGSGNPVLSVVYPPDTWQLAGFNDWGHPIDFVNGSCQVNLTAKTYTEATDAGFKLIKNGTTYYGCNGTMTRSSCTDWTFYDGVSNNNCGITADEAGTYTFTINTSSANPQLTVTYPVASLKSIAEVIGATTSTENTLTVTMNNWVITAVSGNQAYITDGTLNGMLCYLSGHGFTAGDHLSGTIEVKSKVYNQQPEFTSLKKGMTGLITTSGSLPTPIEVTDLATVNQVENQGILISFKNAPYNAKGYFEYDEDDNFINYEDKFNTGVEPQGGSNYDVTGLVCATYYSSKLYLNVAPLKASDIQEVVAKYDASFDANGHGTAPAAQSQVSSVTLAAITGVTGWTNDYWTADVAVKDGSNNTLAAGTHLNNATTYKLTANTTFTAHWQVNFHTLTWELDGGSTTSGSSEYTHGTVEYGATITAPADPTKANKKFAGWMQNSVVVTPATTMPDNNLTYVAKWVDITWTDYLTDCSAPDTWFLYIDGEIEKSGEMTANSKTVELVGNRNYGFKLYKNVEGDSENQIWYTDGTGAQDPGTITVDNCTGWNFKNTTPGSGNTGIRTTATGNYTFSFEIVDGYPRVSVTYPTAYQVSYEANGGTGTMNPSDYCAAGGTITLATNTFEKTGNHFNGWVANVDVKIGGATVTAGTLIVDGATIQDINSNITLTAQWEKKVTALTISQEFGIDEIVVGEDVQLTLTVTPNDAEYGTSYTWYSSNTSTMEVSQSGVVTGVQANTGDYIYVRNNDGVESNHYVINVKSAACDTWGLHMWNTEKGTSRDFCFTQVGSTTEWRTQQVTLPSNSDKEQLKVLYAGKDGYYTAQWTTRWVPTVGYQQGNCTDASDGNLYAGQDVKGYFRICDEYTDPNYHLAFQPVYAVMYGVEKQTWQQVEFTDTEIANNFYTGIITVPEGYDSNVEIYAGTSKASGVFFINGRSRTVMMNTITGLTGSGMAGKAGKFKINDNYCNESNFNLSFIRYYRLHYNLDGGEGTGDYTDKFALPSASAEFTLETAPTKDGFTFRGWRVSIGGGAATTKQPGESVPLTEDAVVTAIWAENYTVTYDLEGYSTSCSSSTVHYCGEEVTVCPAPEDKTGYTFMGWNTDDITGSPADFGPGTTFTMPCKDVVFTADYQAVSYAITYEGLEGATNPNPTNYTIESAFDFVAPGTRTGYTFTGWTENGNPITGIVAGTTGIKTITANWSLNSHNVTFNANGHGTAPDGYTGISYGVLITEPTAPADVEEGGNVYTFIGWYKENTCDNAWNFATDVMPDNNLTLYAKWSGVTYEDYRTHCCTPLPAPETRDASNIHMTTATLSWNEVSGNNGYQVSADQVNWENVLSGTSHNLTGLTAGTPYTYYVRAKGDNDAYCQYGTAASIGFTTKAALHITYKANGGTGADVVSDDIEEGASATVAANTFTAPTGMTFNGWNTATDGTGTAYAVGATINPLNADLTLYAQWIGATFNVTYDFADGTGDCENTTATYNSTFTICSTIPTKGTNAFTGWLRSDNSEIYQPGATFTMPASNVTLTAQWAESYTVTYVIKNVEVSGPNPAGDVYVAQGQPTTLPDFEFNCSLYNQFIGWVSAEVAKSEEKIACPNIVGKPGDSFTPTGNITLYALFGHDAENLGWVKQTTISSGKYIMATGTTVMTGFDAAQKSTINNGSCTNVDESSTGVYNPTTVESAIQVQAILGTGGNAGKFALQYGDYYIVPDGGYLNYNVTDVANAYTWKLTDGSQVSDKDCAAGVLQNAGSTTYICQKNSSQAKYKMYTNTQGATNCVYLYKLINEGYYTTSPTCEIPTSVTVTYHKNTEDEVTMCEDAELHFTTYPYLTEAYTLCAAADVVCEGYVLRTWNTAANGTGKDYTPGTVFTELGNNLNLYAQWDRVYTVTFHDKYGSAEATTTKVTQASLGSTINVPSAALDDDCISFVGWTSESTVQSGNPVQPAIVIAAGTGTYTPEEDMHLYAIYSKEGSALDFAPATEGVRSFYLANTALTAYATGTIGTSSTGNKFSSEATADNATPIFIDYQTSHVGNYKYTIRTANGYLAPATGGTAANFMSQAEPYYWNIVSGSDGGYNITASNSTTRQISYSDQYFGFYTYLTSVKLVPCAASTFWSNPTCAEFVTITFQTVGDITINWTGSRGTAEDYKDLPINTSITQWPTAQYEGWTFAGWSKVDYSNSSKYAGSFAEDTKNGTIQPDQSDGLYANENAMLELIANNNYNMYPIFTKVHESTEFDEAIGGDYLIYFRGEGTRYKDDYTKFDNEYLRVYATDYSGSAYHSTSSCAEAYTFTFVKRADGNWDIKRGTNYLCNTNDNDIYEQASLPDYGWTMTKQINGSYIIHYLGNTDERKYIRVLDLGSGPITNSTFKCYSQDQEHSGMYMPVYIGSCVERQYSSEPSNKPTLEMAGAVYTTSTNGQNVRSATGYTIKGSFLKANTEISLTDASGNAIAGLSIVGSDGKAIKADANGMLAETTAYVVYTPTETTDGIENREICVSALDRSDVAITSEAKSINNIHLRHLPAKFLIAQKVGADWYALPNDMTASMSNPAAAKLLSVNEATGTATIYSDVENIYAYTLLAGKASTANMVFNSQAEGKTGSALRSSTTESETTMGLYATSSWKSTTPAYEFTPATEDLKDYTLTNALQNADLGIADGNWVISGDQTVRFFAIDQQTPVNLTLSGNVALTSANNIEVYGNQTSNLLTISANYTNVAKLRYTYNDGTSDVAVSNSVFRLNYYEFPDQTNYNKADATTANHRIDVSTLTGEVDQTFSVSLKPKAANTMYNYTLTIAALDASDNVMEEKQITLKGRSLPEPFVIAMKNTNDNKWYALPNDLATSTSGSSSTKAPLLISVDNTTAPTKALMAPKNTLYKGDSRYEATEHRNAIRFLRADATNKAWITTSSTSLLYMPDNNSDNQQFNLLSSDLAKYTITQDGATKTIAMD
ncbi:MAG: InlB B-repeat-containing protein, partial [Bacteroidales bacterium]|nr:InlB B-repeat-containing protein [Candidatus Colicola equi]